MRTLNALPFLLACLASGALAPAAIAQNGTPGGKLQPLEDLGEPNTAIPAPQTGRFSSTETRLPGGRVTEIEVRSGASRYYLQPQTAAGGARSDSPRPVQWNILNFDLPRAANPSAGAATAAPVPPPPRAD